MTDIDAVVARLRQLPDVSGGLVELEPGIDDARMDSWPVPVPAEIRVLFRCVGGIRITVRRSVVNRHTSAEHIDFTESFNNGEYLGHDVSWYLEHAGGPGSHWFVHLDHGDGHFYVDVDRETDARSADDPVLREVAAGLPDDAFLADLRSVVGVTEVLFGLPVSCRYARRHGGAVLTAVQWDGE
ncbi:hypothetical protein WKI65_41130 [Streptomyces sp. MS1.AVA.3]|uniref:hypothetical protein n=1 Tax=Streptomyces decoyicus TaxID=249567 RepID=UPI0030BAB2DF